MRAPYVLRPNKEPKRVRTREARAKAIDDAMAKQPQLIADYRARMAAQHKSARPGFQTLYRRLLARRGRG